MLFAPHPDDESLACSIILQHAVRSGAAVRVVYATDGDDNPWPQRVLERKWRLSANDRKRWGKLRRAEALAALNVLEVRSSAARFVGLPDQKLTTLLTLDCRSTLDRFAAIITDWTPTHLLVPSISDTHPDHSALAVMMRLVLSESLLEGMQMSVWSYAVHGKSPAFFHRARALPQSESETAAKLRAIRCHKTQLKLSRKRFLGYATRPERLLDLRAHEKTAADGSIRSVSREQNLLRVELQFAPRTVRLSEPALFILGYGEAGALHCGRMRLPARASPAQILDCATLEPIARARYRGSMFAGELRISTDIFSSVHRLFVKLEQRSWFFDEAGWLEVLPTHVPQIAASKRAMDGAGQVAAR